MNILKRLLSLCRGHQAIDALCGADSRLAMTEASRFAANSLQAGCPPACVSTRIAKMALLGFAVVSGASCGDTDFFGGTSAPVLGASILHLVPEVFVGEVACRPNESGQFQSYVVDLYDPRVTADGGLAEPLASSLPARCDREVEFGVPGGQPFVLLIKGYDLSTSELRLRELSEVAPIWRAECGTESLRGADAGLDTSAAIVSVPGRPLVVTNCTKLALAQSSLLEVDLSPALGGLQCGSEPGQVESFTATVNGRSRTADCEDVIRFKGLEPGEYSIAIRANLAGAGDAGVVVISAGPDAGCSASGSPSSLVDAGSVTGGDVTDAGAGAPDAALSVNEPDAGPSAVAPDASLRDDSAEDSAPVLTPVICADAGAEISVLSAWQTLCTAVVQEGRTVSSECPPLKLQVLPR